MSQVNRPLPPALREVEHKFSVATSFDLPDLTAGGRFAVEADPPFTQTATYYDTADLRLFRWGITIRRRSGGTDDGWHLKLPRHGSGGGKHVRDELQLPLNEENRPPTAFTELLSAFLRGSSLAPAVTLQTRRSISHVRDQGGVEIAEVADDVVAVLNGRSIATEFREIEVEERDSPDAREVVALIRATGARPTSISKAAAALGPSAQADAEVPAAAAVNPSTPAGEVVTAYLSSQVRTLLFDDVQVRLGADDSVHQLRVAVRRLRSALRTFSTLLDRPAADRLRDELSWLAGELGPARDTEVLLARLLKDAGTLDAESASRVTALVHAVLAPRLTIANDRAVASLRSARHSSLVVDLVTGATGLALPIPEPAREVVPQLIQKAYRNLAKSAKGLRPEGPSAEWHRTRILAKRARYAAEAAVPIFGAQAAARASALELVTECLGEHQDAWLAQHTLIELAAVADGPAGLAMGRLVEHEIAIELAARDRFRQVWPDVARVNESGWELS